MSRNEHDSGLTRRQLLANGAAATAGVAVASTAAGKVASAAPSKKVPTRVLGKTNKKIPILLIGAAMKFDKKFDPKLAEAFTYGANYIDTAIMYGSEKAVGSYMKVAKNRDKLWITSKSPDHEPASFERALGRSLRDMSTPYVDLYYLHALRDKSKLNAAMGKTVDKLKKSGKMKHFGFSAHHGNVAELLNEAAKHSYVESVMFRYNFRQYGDKELNKAMDAAHKAGVGLIAMKTQGSAASFAGEWKKFKQTGKWNKHQSVLKAVWADKRITAAVSHMDTLGKLRQNIGAAIDNSQLSRAEWNELDRYAAATQSYTCNGCSQICQSHIAGGTEVADVLRFLMYHEVYGEKDKAKRLYQELPAIARERSYDMAAAHKACPNGVNIAWHLERAEKLLG